MGDQINNNMTILIRLQVMNKDKVVTLNRIEELILQDILEIWKFKLVAKLIIKHNKSLDNREDKDQELNLFKMKIYIKTLLNKMKTKSISIQWYRINKTTR